MFVCVVSTVSRNVRYMNDDRVKALYNERTVNIAGDIIFDKVFYYINLRGFRIIKIKVIGGYPFAKDF
jgi:hypothetical protein